MQSWGLKSVIRAIRLDMWSGGKHSSQPELSWHHTCLIILYFTTLALHNYTIYKPTSTPQTHIKAKYSCSPLKDKTELHWGLSGWVINRLPGFACPSGSVLPALKAPILTALYYLCCKGILEAPEPFFIPGTLQIQSSEMVSGSKEITYHRISLKYQPKPRHIEQVKKMSSYPQLLFSLWFRITQQHSTLKATPCPTAKFSWGSSKEASPSGDSPYSNEASEWWDSMKDLVPKY